MLKSALVVGCGFVGLPLARLLHFAGWDTLGITASPESAARLGTESFAVSALDITDRRSLSAISGRAYNLIVHCASSGKGAAEAYQKVYLDGTRNLLATLRCNHYIFASSTSVYAQTDGSWVDEESETAPTRETGRILLETEAIALQFGGTVGRLAGLYGPGRCAPLRKLLAGEAVIEGKGERFMNMIHRDDAAGALYFLAQQPSPGCFNLVDDNSPTQLEWYTEVCRRLGKPLPAFGPRNFERKRGWTNKRVSNKKLRSLGWKPVYPTFLDGLSSC
jgi:nucleoside-diphosphate-sugar epimerase